MGMFWEDRPVQASQQRQEGPMPAIPETGWRPPTEFPNLSAARILSIDTETWDPELTSAGPGWARGKGHLVGFSIAADGSPGWYFPIRHEAQTELNLDPQQCLRWLDSVLRDSRPKVGANIIYDLGWLRQEGVRVGGRFYDVQHAEALLNSEAPSVALDDLAETHLGRGKESSLLYEFLAKWFGGSATGTQRKHIHRAPPSLVGPYGEADATLPIAILNKQWPLLAERGVSEVFDVECRLIPLLLEMRWKGCPIDVEYAERYHAALADQLKQLTAELAYIGGRSIRPSASSDIAAACDALGLSYPMTATGKPSFVAGWLENQEHPLFAKINEYRKLEKLRGTFIESYLLNSHVNGRVYCSFNQLKGDGTGARSGRFSSSDPNLQNIPVRTDEGKMIRAAFVPRGARWRKIDYSQIEYRLLAHHAVGPGADGIRSRYNLDPNTDYHEATIELIRQFTGIVMPRRNAKTINFGLIYGMGKMELIHRLGLSKKDGVKMFDSYHQAVPFAKATMDAAAEEVHATGFVRTVMGRVSDFPLWGPAEWAEDMEALPFAQAILKYPKVKRAFTHKALNRKLQGGAADLMKKAMVECYEGGLFADTACGIPLLTVHDELDFDDEHDDPNHPAWAELVHVMETVLPLRVPVIADMSMGKSWGSAD